MKISGVVIFKNEKQFFLKESVLSFLKLCDEIIAVDNGSTDGGAQILAELNDPRIHILYKPSLTPAGRNYNKDYGELRNYAMQFCKGDYIFNFDADEILGDNYEYIKEQLRADPEQQIWSVRGKHYYWFLNREDATLDEHIWLNRLHKNDKNIRYPNNRSHGLPNHSDIDVGVKTLKSLFIHHYGYCKNLCFDFHRYNMNYDIQEIHNADFLNNWIYARAMDGFFPMKECRVQDHPSIIRDKFKVSRWNK